MLVIYRMLKPKIIYMLPDSVMYAPTGAVGLVDFLHLQALQFIVTVSNYSLHKICIYLNNI